MREFYRTFEETLQEENLYGEIGKMKEQIYSKRKPVAEIKSLLALSGFSITRIISDTFTIRCIDGRSMLNHYLIKYWFLPGWKDIVKEEDRIPVFEKVERKLNRYAESKGELSLSVPYITIDCKASG